MLLTESRRASRVAGGELVTLDEQDRGGWDRAMIDEGHALVRECLARRASDGPRPGQYQILAAINAVHTDAPTAAATDWAQIATLYGQLAAVAPSPIVELNRAVAIAELDGPELALTMVDRLAAGVVPLLARHPRRPAPPARPERRGAGGVRRRARAHRQRGRAGLPRPGGGTSWRGVVLGGYLAASLPSLT